MVVGMAEAEGAVTDECAACRVEVNRVGGLHTFPAHLNSGMDLNAGELALTWIEGSITVAVDELAYSARPRLLTAPVVCE